MRDDGVRRDLAAAYRRVTELGLNVVSSGNLSARVDGGMLVSPTGATAATIEPGSLALVGDDGTWDRDGPTPSSEWRMHLAVYQRVPEARAIVHTHSDHCVALASHGRPLPGFTYVVGFFGGTDIPCVPYHTFGSQALADAAAAALVDRTACLLANHGMIGRGPDLAAAVDGAQRLEILCRQYLIACRLGPPDLLSDDDWRDFFAQAERLAAGDVG